MTLEDITDIDLEIERFKKRLKDLLDCTRSANNTDGPIYKSESHTSVFGYDEGLNGCTSKRRASVKRAALDLRQELLRLTK
jgi:hypothetical protein